MKESLFDPMRRFGGIGIHQVSRIVQKYQGKLSFGDRVVENRICGAEVSIWIPRAELKDDDKPELSVPHSN
ncbi:MAG: hypothetical protein P1Q69_15230 [Candidatus Thorarchaeota archaeon]|nr:hypothetical protein [Candidatus Thorarchaeota archaeon]